ncbi:chloride transport protein 6-like [Mizuhopecten yessoensis]|uniref:chloride transport protein 6-like n=1 Tax=Mizuhopecten yessoensis TaxID=6573 RepID=UPI000B459B06|nr:chloride transport protein 6-like [Mizuhopecten yessoensis]
MDGCTCCRRGNLPGDDRTGETRVHEMRPLLSTNSHRQNILPRKDYESLDYDRCFNRPYQRYVNELGQQQSALKLALVKWIVTFLVGFLTGMVALFIDFVVKKLTKLKFDTVEDSILQCSEDGCLVVPLLYLLLFNVGFVIVASCLVVIEPIAGGSGIPEIKCYLNGVKVPRVGRLLTLVSKSVGVLFSVAGGLFVGKEGPMIHSGAIIGAGVPQFQSIAFKKVNLKKYSFFRTDRDKRDFVSGGAAAGVAAAFGAPIGGVLFSLEEGCSFWNQSLTWRTFFCSMAATYTLNFFLSGIDSESWGYFYLPGLINFGVFKCTNELRIDCRLWDITDLAIFVVMGFLGGLMGALFNTINTAITKHRMKHLNKKHKLFRILEAALVAAVTTSVTFGASMALGECSEIPTNFVNGTSSSIEDTVRTYFCPDGYYNDMATLFFNSQEEAIKQLFHQPGTDGFSLRTLGLFTLFFFFLACWTYGTNVPSGLFVPCLLCGAAYGRFVARLLVLLGYGNQAIHSGTFALVGAAAFLGGVVRMTISLTVILIESTNEISYGLPLMLVLMVAKWSGDLFNEGLYDIHIKLRGVPLLEWEVPTGMERLKAEDIMERKLHFLYPRTRVTSIVQILRTTAHNAFPIVSIIEDRHQQVVNSSNMDEEEPHSPTEQNIPKNVPLRMDGLILRSQLVTLLKKGAMHEEHHTRTSQFNLSYEEMTEDYPRYPDIYDVTKSQNLNQSKLVDVVPYMNPCPYTVYPTTPVPQVFNLFRSMGLRHLPVVSHEGQVLGMVTRHNLTHEFLEARLEELHEDRCLS